MKPADNTTKSHERQIRNIKDRKKIKIKERKGTGMGQMHGSGLSSIWAVGQLCSHGFCFKPAAHVSGWHCPNLELSLLPKCQLS